MHNSCSGCGLPATSPATATHTACPPATHTHTYAAVPHDCMLQARNVMFQHSHNKPMSVVAAAQLLSNTLYYKRFFPYYTFNLCAGLDEEGAWLLDLLARCHPFLLCILALPSACFTSACTVPVAGSCAGRRRLGSGGSPNHYMHMCCSDPSPRPCLLPAAGKGAVYTYDAIGSYERTGYSCQVRIGRAPATWKPRDRRAAFCACSNTYPHSPSLYLIS